jgi:hypothetical protein
MKRLQVWIALLLVSFNSFSQIDTKVSKPAKVVLSEEVARQVVKDLIEADFLKLQLVDKATKVELLTEQNNLFKSSVYTLQTKNDFLEGIIKARESQIEIEKELNRRLSADLRRETRRSRTSNMIVVGVVVALGYTLISQ